jgi:hypothetical protein
MPQTHGSVSGTARTNDSHWVANPANGGTGVLESSSRAVGSAQGAAFATDGIEGFKARSRVAAKAGATGNVTVSLQGSQDGSTGWTNIASFPNQSDVGQVARYFNVRGWPHLRWAWTVAGSNVTFGVEPATFTAKSTRT